MDPILTPSYLEYGITGVLALVLIGVGVWLTWYAKEQQSFIRELVKDIHSHTDDWRSLVEKNIQSNTAVTAVMNELAKNLEQGNARHEQSIAVLTKSISELQIRRGVQ